jgi:hypothetical protein
VDPDDCFRAPTTAGTQALWRHRARPSGRRRANAVPRERLCALALADKYFRRGSDRGPARLAEESPIEGSGRCAETVD